MIRVPHAQRNLAHRAEWIVSRLRDSCEKSLPPNGARSCPSPPHMAQSAPAPLQVPTLAHLPLYPDPACGQPPVSTPETGFGLLGHAMKE